MFRNAFSTSRILVVLLALGIVTALTALSPAAVGGIQTADPPSTTSPSPEALLDLEPAVVPYPATYSTVLPSDNPQEVISGTEVFSMPFTAEDEPVLLPEIEPAADNKGTDFWLAFPGNYDLTSSLSLFITADVSTSGAVTISGLNFSYQFQVQAGQLIRVSLPQNSQTNTSDVIQNLGIHVTAQREVTVYGLNQRQYTTDAYLALPKDILGREYIVLTYPITGVPGTALGLGSRFMIAAAENNTRVTITPSVRVGPRPAGTPYVITLNQGQTYQLSLEGSVGADLSGSIVTSDKPVAVFGAHLCTLIPNGYLACDHIVEQLFPTTAWGRNFVSMPLATRTRGDTFRILASQNNTSVYVNGVRVAVLNRGSVHERIISGPANITADRPILVAQYSNSSDYDHVTSDPFMMLLPPYEQFLTSYRIATPSSGIARNFVNVVAPAAAVGSIRINGTVIPASSFVTIGSTGYKGANVSIALGTHTLTGSMPFGVTVYGFDNYDSYGYPGGLSLSPVATVTTLTLTPANGTPTIGTDYCVTARARDQNGSPVRDIRVDFVVTGVHNRTGSATTNAQGDAVFCYRGTVVGNDTIRASVGTLTATAAATWIAPTPTHTPTPTRTATPTPTATHAPPTATPPLATPTATPDFPVCTVTLDKIAYPSTANINGEVGVTLRLTGDCPGEIGAAVDVALVFDRSDSMCGASLNQAQDAGQAFLDSMALPPDQVSVISFAGTAQMHTGLTSNRTQAANALYNITCGGISRLDVGLNRAFDEMNGPRRVAGHTPAVILLTDGNPTGSYANDVRAAAQRIREAGIQFYTVGLGPDVNAALLLEIATAPDHYYQSPAPADLVQIYSRLAGEVRVPPGFNVDLTDIVGQQFAIVPGSFSGAATPTVTGRTLRWYLPRIEEGVTEVSFAVRPLQCGTFNTNQLAQVSYDDNRGNRHTRNFPVPTITVNGCTGDLTDVYMRDNLQDTGTIPSAEPWWDSPDIWVRHADDNGTQHQNPQAGQRNYLYARVLNRGTTTVNSITVNFYYGLSGLGLGWPSGWTPLSLTRTIPSIAPGGSAVVSIPWDVPNLAGHFCLRVHITAAPDPILDYRVGWDNNIAQRNFHVVEYPQPPASQCRFDQNGMVTDTMRFDVTNTLNTSSMVDLRITASGLPQNATMLLNMGALNGRWSSLDGLTIEPDQRLRVTRLPATVYGVRLNPHEQRQVQMEITAPANSRFTVSLAELVRGNLVGGNSYQRSLPACPVNLPLILKAPRCTGGTYTPPDVLLVIDRSGSMSGVKLSAAKSAAVVFLGQMNLAEEQAGLVSFNSGATLNQTLTHSLTQLTTAVNNLAAGGGTAIHAGINTAQAELQGPRQDPSHSKAMILLTDGQSNASQALAAANAAKQAGTVIFTVGLGADADANLLRQIATSPDHYYYAPTPADLEEIYLAIAGQVGCTP